MPRGNDAAQRIFDWMSLSLMFFGAACWLAYKLALSTRSKNMSPYLSLSARLRTQRVSSQRRRRLHRISERAAARVREGVADEQFEQAAGARAPLQASTAPRLVAIFGAALLAGGAAAPLVHIPIAGTISYLWHPGYLPGGFTEGAAVILTAAAASIILAIVRRFKPLWLTGTIALAQLMGTLIAFHHSAARVVAEADTPDLVDPMVMWAGAALDRAHFQWGIAIIAGGALMILVAAGWEYWKGMHLTRS